MSISLDKKYLNGFIDDAQIAEVLPQIEKAHNDLNNKTGAGSEYTGWLDLPSRIEDSFISDVEKLGEEVRGYSDALISIGIGGSYLGIRATVEFVRGSKIPVYYAGHNMSSDYMHELLEVIKTKDVVVTVISKSGTTTEPAVAFRLIKQALKEKYSDEELKKRIICVTDEKKGALRQIADQEGYKSFVIPDDVGGRFSILTPVGLVPLAIAGVDIKGLVDGARAGEKEYNELNLESNIAYQYAAIRYLLSQKGKVIEMMASFYDNNASLLEWWKQLYGESEGKNGKGIFPASTILSTDLHSMGQLMQDGMRNIFETFIDIQKTNHAITIPEESEDLDKFNILAGKELDYVNTQAFKATAEAHFEGGVPNITLTLCQADSYHLGQLYYMFEKAVAISGYLLDVNPFDQPGVEAYKSKMFALLGKK